jgi:hypothetical protein
MQARRSWLWAVGIVAIILHPAATWACPACFGASSQAVWKTYLLTAAALTLLPFAIIGTIAGIVRRVQRQAAVAAALAGDDRTLVGSTPRPS